MAARRRLGLPLEAAKPGVTSRPAAPRSDGTPGRGPCWQPYKWKQFGPGNEASRLHGAGDLFRPGKIDATGHRRGLSLRAQERAEAFLAEVLASDAFPEYLKAPMFRNEVIDWARAQTQADMVWEWFQSLPEDERHVPQRTGFQKTPLDQYLGIAGYAARCRNRLGLNPVSYAKLRVALGLHKRAEEDAIAGLGKKGAKIRRQREAQVIQMRAEDGEGA